MYASCADNLIESYVRTHVSDPHEQNATMAPPNEKRTRIVYSFTHFDIDKS